MERMRVSPSPNATVRPTTRGLEEVSLGWWGHKGSGQQGKKLGSAVRLGLNPDFAANLLCDLGLVTQPRSVAISTLTE